MILLKAMQNLHMENESNIILWGCSDGLETEKEFASKTLHDQCL
jgi:hypothetical protein